MTTIFMNHTGPLMLYDHDRGALIVEDLNPSMSTKWRISRAGLLRMAWGCLLAAVRY